MDVRPCLAARSGLAKQEIWPETQRTKQAHRRQQATMKSAIRLPALACVLTLAACGGGVNGTYVGQEGSFLDRIELASDGKALITYDGETAQGSYRVDGNQVSISNAGDTEVLTLDRNCLRGRAFIGSYCK